MAKATKTTKTVKSKTKTTKVDKSAGPKTSSQTLLPEVHLEDHERAHPGGNASVDHGPMSRYGESLPNPFSDVG